MRHGHFTEPAYAGKGTKCLTPDGRMLTGGLSKPAASWARLRIGRPVKTATCIPCVGYSWQRNTQFESRRNANIAAVMAIPIPTTIPMAFGLLNVSKSKKARTLPLKKYKNSKALTMMRPPCLIM